MDFHRDLETELLHPPLRFGCVQQGVYRSAYPILRNFRFLSRLKLCTIVSLTPEAPSTDMVAFAEVAGIRLVHVAISRTSSLNTSLQAALVSVLNHCINTANHPILVHCLDGRRVIGILILLLRRLQGWAPLPAMNEFWRYQVASRLPIPASEIERTTRDLEKFTAGAVLIQHTHAYVYK
jgi:tyrosine-protein phosphatase OCA6